MSLARPQFVWLAVILIPPLLVMVSVQGGRRRRLGDAFGGPVPSLRLSGRDLYRFPVARVVCLSLAAALLALALAEPRIGSGMGFDDSRPVDLQIMMDVSASMTAADVDADRLRRARHVVEEVAGALSAERVGLAIFADWPLTLLPPTDDEDLVLFFAGSVSGDLVQSRDQGTSLTQPLVEAGRALDEHGRPGARRIILLLTDGDISQDEAVVLDSVAALRARDTRVWVGGVGTSGGAVLDGSTTGGGAVLDATGQMVVSRLNAEFLGSIAAVGGGAYFDVTNNAGLGALIRRFRRSDSAAGPGLTLWMVVLAAGLIGIEGALDSGVRFGPVRRKGGRP